MEELIVVKAYHKIRDTIVEIDVPLWIDHRECGLGGCSSCPIDLSICWPFG